MVLDEGGPVVQRQLGGSVGVSARYVTELVDALEADRLVVRRPHPTDRRARLVALTRRGKAAAAQMRSEREGFARLLFGDVEPTELEGLVAVLDRVIARLEGLEAE